jgi:hypothetical protein
MPQTNRWARFLKVAVVDTPLKCTDQGFRRLIEDSNPLGYRFATTMEFAAG